jgi:hypothetical protein
MQEYYLALIKPYWQIIIASYRLVLQVLCEVSEILPVALKSAEPLYSHVCEVQ